MSGRLYLVIKSFPWIEGGKPAPPGVWWEGGTEVTYQPGDFVYMEDQDLGSMYRYVEALDEAGRAVLEEARAKAEAPAKTSFLSSLSAEQHNVLGWALVRSKITRGEGLKETLLWAIRNGLALPDDLEERAWIADALEGKLDPERGRGRPRKKQREDIIRVAVERGIAETYTKWLEAFERDRELAWLRYEALRLCEEQPDAAVWHRGNDLHVEEARQSFKTALTALGACPCPPAARGAETARELALRATAQERGAVWESKTGKRLTPPVVAHIVTRARAKKSK